MENWVAVFETTEEFEAERAKEVLQENEIPAVIMNHKDSTYVSLGELHVMVHKDNQKEAEEIINSFNRE